MYLCVPRHQEGKFGWSRGNKARETDSEVRELTDAFLTD